MNKRTDVWWNGCFRNHHPQKMDVLPKFFFSDHPCCYIFGKCGGIQLRPQNSSDDLFHLFLYVFLPSLRGFLLDPYHPEEGLVGEPSVLLYGGEHAEDEADEHHHEPEHNNNNNTIYCAVQQQRKVFLLL